MTIRKYTTALSYRVSIRTLRTVRRKAEQQGKLPAMEIEMSGGMMFPPERWVCVPYEVFNQLLKGDNNRDRN